MTNKINDGGAAFPTGFQPGHCEADCGMTLRDYFAAKAMQGILTADADDTITFERVSELAYKAADAMLRAREEQPWPTS